MRIRLQSSFGANLGFKKEFVASDSSRRLLLLGRGPAGEIAADELESRASSAATLVKVAKLLEGGRQDTLGLECGEAALIDELESVGRLAALAAKMPGGFTEKIRWEII